MVRSLCCEHVATESASGVRSALDSPMVQPHVGRFDSVRAHPPRAMSPYVTFLLYLMAILGFLGLVLTLNAILGPKPAETAVKQEPFECGATPVDFVNVKAVPIKYYAVAIIFILFDLETMFLFIWTLGARPLSGFMMFTLFLFIFLLVISLLYVYKARILEAVTE
jgi:NADH-quinone oxidoreductase subunit A